ncbi:hypothetical protein ASG23_13475 [Cellulomonas sp. Leaf395]|nr:hypothetical protein ASG23_13475 [Cellulomonas sp. Leaf395]
MRRLRTARGLTQEHLAHVAALDRTYVGAVENGRRNLSLHAMWQLAEALRVSPEAFFCDEAAVDDYLATAEPGDEETTGYGGTGDRADGDSPTRQPS